MKRRKECAYPFLENISRKICFVKYFFTLFFEVSEHIRQAERMTKCQSENIFEIDRFFVY